MRFLRNLAATAILSGMAIVPAAAQQTTWVDTWSASPQPVWEADFFASPAIPRAMRDQTLRQVARISLGGDAVRVELSNEYGDRPLVIGDARIALAGADGAIVAGTDHALTFAGKTDVVIPPGAPMWSDPVEMSLDDLAEVAVSLYLPEATPLTTWHNDARQTAYYSASGNQAGADSFEAAGSFNSRIFLSGIAVEAAEGARSVVLFGDSITDGDGSTPNQNNRWPDVLAERLSEAGAEVSVLNEGISGDRVLRDRLGVNALARFGRDVLTHPGADTVVIMIGINDIGWPDSILVPPGEPAPSAEEVIAGLQQMIYRAKSNGMKVIGATLTPFEDTFQGGPLEGFYNEDKEVKRVAVNDWIRNSGAYDAVLDFDALVQDAANPRHIAAEFDSGDHLHPNDAGYVAMANSIGLDLLGVAK